MKNIHVLITDKPSRLHTYKGILNLAADEFVAPTIVKNDLINQNIYITSDEEIKEGDWFLDRVNQLWKCDKDILKIDKEIRDKWYKKIILTNNEDLIADGVQAIDDEFLGWFVENPSCEYVDVKFKSSRKFGMWKPECYPQIYKIIIPQEEPKQIKCYCGHTITCDCEPLQETLEEAAENVFNDFKSKNPIVPQKHILPFKHGYIQGAKWQAEKILELILNEDNHTEGELGNSCIDVQTLRYFIEQFKKK